MNFFKSKNKEDLKQINKFTTRKFKANQLHIFSVILCDNEIDRDFEQFTSESLQKLKELFVGKLGIFDCNTKEKKQIARIFKTEVMKDQVRKNQLGEPYEYLLAKAYIVKTKENKDLVLEIEGGTKNEVSIGCSIGKKVCGICGKDITKEYCEHKKGKVIKTGNGENYEIGFVKLLNPVEAYEFSFVQIPTRLSILKKTRLREN